MKVDLGKVLFLILFLTLSAMTVMAGTIKGTITDKQTKEPLTGATVQVAISVSPTAYLMVTAALSFLALAAAPFAISAALRISIQ